MLNWALMFFVVAIIAAALGMGGVAGMSAHIGWLLAVIGLIVLVVSIVAGQRRGGPPIV
jgi:uncharacterized membrane protein YtjA (UPF0391 family)